MVHLMADIEYIPHLKQFLPIGLVSEPCGLQRLITELRLLVVKLIGKPAEQNEMPRKDNQKPQQFFFVDVICSFGDRSGAIVRTIAQICRQPVGGPRTRAYSS
jgi:hypothetical protein